MDLLKAPTLSKTFLFRAKRKLTHDFMNAMKENPDHKVIAMYMGPRLAAVATHPDTARQILTQPDVFLKSGNEAVVAPLRKSIVSKMSVVNTERKDIIALNGKEGLNMRKKLNPRFSVAALNSLVPVFADLSTNIFENWEQSSTEKSSNDELFKVDAKAEMSQYALDVLGAALIGKFDKELYKDYKIIMGELGNSWRLVFPFMEKFPFPSNIRLRNAVDNMHEALVAAVANRKKLWEEEQLNGTFKEEPRDILDVAIASFPEEAVVANVWLMFIAGHDTTAIALAWHCYFLSKYPALQSKAREEARSVLWDGQKLRDPTAEDLETNMPYISNFIKESLRLCPPVHNLITRYAGQDVELGDYLVPEGSAVSISISNINRHPDVWERPDEFDPDRWNTKVSIFNCPTFSAGPRNCLGDKFSLLEQKTMLLMLLARYEILSRSPSISSGSSQQESSSAAEDYNVPIGDLPFSGDSLPIFFCQPDSLNITLRRIME